jgi:hypothetical protein
LSRFDCRKDQRGHKQPEQDRPDHQGERENHRGHSAHDPTEVNGNPRCIRFQAAARKWRTPGPRPGVRRSLVPKFNHNHNDRTGGATGSASRVCPLLGVKRTSLSHRKMSLMTQSGHCLVDSLRH